MPQPREELLRALNRERYVHPQDDEVAHLQRVIRGGQSDNLVLVGTPHDLIERWAAEQLVPVEPRAHTHGYDCQCPDCQDCGPVIEIPVQSGSDPLSALALCLLSWVALAWSVVAVVRLLI